MNPMDEHRLMLTRRQFFGRTSAGIGVAALASLLNPRLFAAPGGADQRLGVLAGSPHFAPKAKRVIYLFQSGGPSHMDTLDYQPAMADHHGEELPDSIRMGQRITGMTSGQSAFPVAASRYQFRRHGRSGAWVSELLPHIGSIADEIAIVKSMHTEAINHDPAVTYIQTGHQQPGRPSMGSWASYGLGSENQNLPSFVVLVSSGRIVGNMQPLFSRLWSSGFLPSSHQGVQFRAGADPVLYLSNPPGLSDSRRRAMLDGLRKLNRKHVEAIGDPEINARIAQYEMAYRMQSSVPELTDLRDEPEHVFDLYGPDSRKPGTFAANALLARRMVERGVRFIQLYHRGWDHHGHLSTNLPRACEDVDQPSTALVKDLKARGMLDETLVIWGGEFGRTAYVQGDIKDENYGRDHHGRCFSLWMAGGGIKGGIVHGETDDYCYNTVQDPVHIHDLQATVLHCLGVDHKRLTYRFQGRHHRLTDVHGHVVHPILA